MTWSREEIGLPRTREVQEKGRNILLRSSRRTSSTGKKLFRRTTRWTRLLSAASSRYERRNAAISKFRTKKWKRRTVTRKSDVVFLFGERGLRSRDVEQLHATHFQQNSKDYLLFLRRPGARAEIKKNALNDGWRRSARVTRACAQPMQTCVIARHLCNIQARLGLLAIRRVHCTRLTCIRFDVNAIHLTCQIDMPAFRCRRSDVNIRASIPMDRNEYRSYMWFVGGYTFKMQV